MSNQPARSLKVTTKAPPPRSKATQYSRRTDEEMAFDTEYILREARKMRGY